MFGKWSGIALVAVCGAIWCASGVGCGPVKGPGNAGVAKKTYTRDEFTKAVVGKTGEQVIAAVGKPDHTSGVDSSNWFYRNVTTDAVTGKADFQVMIVFRNGVADRVVY